MFSSHGSIALLNFAMKMVSERENRNGFLTVSLWNILPYLKVCLGSFSKLLTLLISDSFPELWEVPLVDYRSKDGRLCNFISSCTPPNTAQEAFELFDSNFERHYMTNRAPFFMLLDGQWLQNSTYFEGMFN